MTLCNSLRALRSPSEPRSSARRMRIPARNLVLVFLLSALVPASVRGQQFGFGLKAGSLGPGVDAAYFINDFLTIRGGVGFITSGSFLNDFLPDEIEDVQATSELPSPSFTLGVDVKIVGPLRVMGGALIQSDDYMAFGELTGESDIGNGTYFPPGSLDLRLDQRSVMPFLGVGFGDVHGEGFGVYADVALAFGGAGVVILGASEDLTSIPGFNEDLDLEESRLNEEWGSLKDLYPVVQLGVRYGFSR